MVDYKHNIDQIIIRLKEKDKRTVKLAQQGMKRGMRKFESKIIKEQMSGRKGSMGLNAPTGTLRRSWFITTWGRGIDFFTRLATTTKYAAVHQFGSEKKNIPKRLTILEDFKKSGMLILTREVYKALIKGYR